MAHARPGAQEPVEARTAKLVRNPAGFWIIRYTQRDPVTGSYRTRETSCRTRDATRAHVELEDWRRTISQIGAAQAQVPPTIQPLIDRWLEDLARDHPDRGKSQRRTVQWPRRLLGDKLPADLTKNVVRDYVRARNADRPLSTGTLRSELNAVRTALTWAKREGLIADVPVFELPPEAPARDVWLDEATEARAHQAALDELHNPPGRNTRDRDAAYHAALFLLIALNTAARREAITDLTWNRVDMAKGMIDFRVPGRRITKKRRVELPIARRLEPVLEHAWLQAQQQGRIGSARIVPTQSVNDQVIRFRERHNLPQLTPHVCRHTWATLAARRGVAMYVIAGVLGDTVTTVTDTYLHRAPEHLKRALDGAGSIPALT